MQLSDFHYHLPEELIARYPLAGRSDSRLLCLPSDGSIVDRQMIDLPDLLNAGDLLVLNDTRVIKARLHGLRASGGAVEVLVERIIDTHTALAHVRASNSPKAGAILSLANDQIKVTVQGRQENLYKLTFDQPVLEALEQYGALPIPPYFNRPADESDETRYQTVFHDPAKSASVAAPTAGLHIDEALLARLHARGVKTAFCDFACWRRHFSAGAY
jgi:S-adenosylmethionine:tRNA ribosyltransferase-isomerase